MNNTHCTVIRDKNKPIPDIGCSYEKLAEDILGKKYELGIVFASTEKATELHETYKNLPGPANILSFPYDKTHGEIIMHLGAIRTQAKLFDHTYHEHICFLLIHGMLHLKGYDHGGAMQKKEEFYMRRWFDKMYEHPLKDVD